MQRDNALANKWIRFALLQLLSIVLLSENFAFKSFRLKLKQSLEHWYKTFAFVETLFTWCFDVHINCATWSIYKLTKSWKTQRFKLFD